MITDLKKVSIYLSLVLKYKPEYAGVTLDEYGWTNVSDLIQGVSKKYPIDIDILEEIVYTDNRQRYQFNHNHTRIRATRRTLNSKTDLVRSKPPENLYFVASKKQIDAIDRDGLMPKESRYVRLTDNIKPNKTAFAYRISSGLMHNASFIFYRSNNGDWLTERIPRGFIEKVR